MNDIFIKAIKINKVLHLQDISIPLSNTERKHLIITGKNGSGKTTLLQEIRNNLTAFSSYPLSYIDSLEKVIKNLKTSIVQYDDMLQKQDESTRIIIRTNILNTEILLKQKEEELNKLTKIELSINNLEFYSTALQNGSFIFSYFGAQRTAQLNPAQGIQKIDLKEVYPLTEKANSVFIQYIANLKVQESFAKNAGNKKLIEDIENWFGAFEGFLKEIFEDENLILEYDNENFKFNIVQSGREKFSLSELSDGYSAIINIISELIMRMESRNSKTYELQGIVLIDELETHLHIELQKLILPFLTRVFPKVQFIVTTHSPFVLSSVSNAVIYDLENRLLVNDLSGYSLDGIVEGYFNSDKYSTVLKQLVEEYELLTLTQNPSEETKERVFELRKYFRNLPKFMAPELNLKINQIELAALK